MDTNTPSEATGTDSVALARRLIDLEDRIDGETALRAELVEGLAAARGPLNALLALARSLAPRAESVADSAVADRAAADSAVADPSAADSSEALAEGLASLARRLDELLDLEAFQRREESGGIEAFDPRRLLEECLTALGVHAGERGIELIADFDPALPERLEGDARGLRDVVRQLIGRCFRRAVGGEILVHLERCGDEGTQARLKLSIEDTGLAIEAAEAQAMLSDTGRKGLHRCVHYAQSSGGEFSIEAGASGGTLVQLTLLYPCLNPAHESDSNSDLLRGTRVLIVDDNQSARSAAERVLTSFGCRVTSVEGVGYAMAELNWAAQEGDPFPICLVDLRMPGNGGFQLAEQMREGARGGETQLVLMYTNCREGDLLEARRHGFVAEVSKPLRVSLLRSTIERLLPSAQGMLPAPRHLRILLAEDNALHRRVARATIEREDHEVCTAASGKEVLEILESEPIDLVLMDLQMPEMDGVFTSRAVRAREAWAGLPIIGMTSGSPAQDRAPCLEAGMNELIAKPLRISELREAIARWCS